MNVVTLSRILIAQFSDEDCGQKYVSVMLDGQETELEIIDRPAAEMSVSERDISFTMLGEKSRAEGGRKVEKTRRVKRIDYTVNYIKWT